LTLGHTGTCKVTMVEQRPAHRFACHTSSLRNPARYEINNIITHCLIRNRICQTFSNRHRSHFGSRFTSGCCGHAGLVYFITGLVIAQQASSMFRSDIPTNEAATHSHQRCQSPNVKPNQNTHNQPSNPTHQRRRRNTSTKETSNHPQHERTPTLPDNDATVRTSTRINPPPTERPNARSRGHNGRTNQRTDARPHEQTNNPTNIRTQCATERTPAQHTNERMSAPYISMCTGGCPVVCSFV
jgi:hypothetical protein